MNVKLSQNIFETPIVRRNNIRDIMYTLLIAMDEIAVIKLICIQKLSSHCVVPKPGNK